MKCPGARRNEARPYDAARPRALVAKSRWKFDNLFRPTCDVHGRVRMSGPDVSTDACEHGGCLLIPDLRSQVCLFVTPDPP